MRRCVCAWQQEMGDKDHDASACDDDAADNNTDEVYLCMNSTVCQDQYNKN